MPQTVTGYAAFEREIREWSRTGTVQGAVTPETVAYAINKAQQNVHDLCLESGMPWCIRNVVVDDIGDDLGTESEQGVFRLFIETDLGITDLARVRRLWRIPATAGAGRGVRLPHIETVGAASNDLNAFGAVSEERWTEDGDFNDDGDHEMSIILFNRGTALEGGHLKVNYWFTPADITPDVFYEEDDDGNLTARPPMPRKVWDSIVDYAKLVILETTGDDYKRNALWARLHGPAGVLERLRGNLAAFQTGDASYVDDSGMGEA
jgi:hypothetical protein